MRIASAIVFTLFAVPLLAVEPLYAQDFRGKAREFEVKIQSFPRILTEQVGVIPTPLPDRRGFKTPGMWKPVKMMNETSVYLVKDGYRFLVPNPTDKSNSSYVLWTKLNGNDPEIIIWPCEDNDARAAHIAYLTKKSHDMEVESEKRRIKNEKDWEQRANDRELRAQAREANRAETQSRVLREHAASKEHHQRLARLQSPLADAAIDRVTKILMGDGTQVAPFSNVEHKALMEIRQNMTAIMALQIQMRDLEWCDAIQNHIAPEMWDTRRDKLKNSDPESVVVWLSREIKRQTRDAEARVDYEETKKAEDEIRRIEMGEK